MHLLFFFLFFSEALAAYQEPEGPQDRPLVVYEVAVFHLGAPPADPHRALGKVLTRADDLSLWVSDEKQGPFPGLSVRRIGRTELPVPGPSYLRLFGYGLDDAMTKKLRASRGTTLITLWSRPKDAQAAVRRAQALALRFAQETDGLLWDHNSRELFSRGTWQVTRIKSWVGDTPAIGMQVAKHPLSGPPGSARIVTVGMSKFGLPDLVVEGLPQSLGHEVSDLLSIAAQSLAQQGPGSREDLLIDTSSLSPDFGPRSGARTALLPGQRVELSLREGDPKEGDPKDLLEVYFASAEELAAVHARLFGSTRDTVRYEVDGDQEMERTRDAARKRLFAMRGEFRHAQSRQEIWQIKGRFRTTDRRNEILWFELQRWDAATLSGFLISSSERIPLKKGARVSISETEIYDYKRIFPGPGGRVLGGTTDALLEARERH